MRGPNPVITIGLRLPAHEGTALFDLARREGISTAGLARQLVSEALERRAAVVAEGDDRSNSRGGAEVGAD